MLRVIVRFILVAIHPRDERMRVDLLRQSGRLAIVQQFPNPALEKRGAGLQERFDAFTNRRTDDAGQQEHEDDADRDFEY